MKNENLPEIGRDLIFTFSGGFVYAGIFDGSDFLSTNLNGRASKFHYEVVSNWAYADESFAAIEQQKQTEQQPAQPASGSPDWEQRRYEIARDVLAAWVGEYGHEANQKEGIRWQCECSVAYADALLAELEKPEQKYTT